MKNLIKVCTILSVVLVMSGCSNPDKATQVLKKQGYTEIHITGYSLFACSEDDFYSTGFEAKSVTGEFVTGAVCSGFFKGNTVRLD